MIVEVAAWIVVFVAFGFVHGVASRQVWIDAWYFKPSFNAEDFAPGYNPRQRVMSYMILCAAFFFGSRV